MRKGNQISFNRFGEVVEVIVRDNTYKVMHRATYKLSKKEDLYNLLVVLEKFSNYTINQILEEGRKWL